MNRSELTASLKVWYDANRGGGTQASDMMAVLIAPAVVLARQLGIPLELFIQGVIGTWGKVGPEKETPKNERGPEAAVGYGPGGGAPGDTSATGGNR